MSKIIQPPAKLAQRITVSVDVRGQATLEAVDYVSGANGAPVPMRPASIALVLSQVLTGAIVQLLKTGEKQNASEQ